MVDIIYSREEILNRVLNNDSLQVKLSETEALNVVYDEGENALKVTGISAGAGDMTKAVYDPAGKNAQILVASDLASYYQVWEEIASANYQATPSSTSVLLMNTDLTSLIVPGMGLQYEIGGISYFGQVHLIASNALTIYGAPLIGDVTALYLTRQPLISIKVIVPGSFADSATTTLIKDDIAGMADSPYWNLQAGRVVFCRVGRRLNDSGASVQPSINILLNGNELLTTPITLPAAGTDTVTSVTEIDTSNYRIQRGEQWDIKVNAASGGTPANDAKDLEVDLVIVPEMS